MVVGARPTDLSAGDLNGDGVADLVTANRNQGTLTLLIASGTFGVYEARTIASASGCQGVEIADINADGHLDIVATHRNTDNIGVHIGTGDGDFQLSLAGLGYDAVDDSVDVDGVMMGIVELGANYQVTGPNFYSFGNWKLSPRDTADVAP